jgi:hypothetical protein
MKGKEGKSLTIQPKKHKNIEEFESLKNSLVLREDLRAYFFLLL